MELYLDKYTLNLNKLKSEDEKTREFIHQIYQDMMGTYRDQLHSGTSTNFDKIMLSYFNTLYYNGYLMDIRDIKLEEILEK